MNKKEIKIPINFAELNIPIFLACPPFYLDNRIKNNIWMTSNNFNSAKIDLNKALFQWHQFYSFLSNYAIVLTLPSHPAYQDQTYLNSIKYLPTHNKFIASNFSAIGRQGEEFIAKNYIETFYSEVLYPPFKFESPDLKFIPAKSQTEGFYIGMSGKRTQIEFFLWLHSKFPDIDIIAFENSDPEISEWLYHLDCLLFVLSSEDIILYTEAVPEEVIKELEKRVNIIDIDEDCAFAGLTNSVRIYNFVINFTNIYELKKSDDIYKIEKKKNETLEKICSEKGFISVFMNGSEFLKSGALASCLVERLNWSDFF